MSATDLIVRISFRLEQQQYANWCWAAVIISLLKYYKHPDSGISQDRLVTQTIERKGANYNSYFDSPNVIDAVMSEYGILNTKINGQVRFDDIATQIEKGLPVVARIQWQEGGGHFIVITGCSNNSNSPTIQVQDPMHGPIEVSFQEFSGSYRSSGHWSHTFFTKAKESK